MDMNRYLLLILAVFLTSLQLSSQTLYFDRLDIKDGLSQNTVNAIIQDSRGFMWFGTKDGLNRYDGTHFKVFKHSMYDDSGLGNNHVRCLVEDSDCNIWAGTNAGLYMYDTEHDRFMEIAISDAGGGKVSSPILALARDRAGRIWISVEAYGIYCHDPATGKTSCRYCSKNPISTLAVDDRTGTVWFAWAAEGLFYTDDGFVNVRPYLLADGSKVVPEDVITFIDVNDFGRIWLGFEKNGVMALNRLEGKIRRIRLDDGPVFVRHILRYAQEELWIGAENGLYIYNTRTGKCQHLVHSSSDQYSLSDNSIHSICRDRDGGIWLGTFFGGINYLPERVPDFRKYYPTGTAGALGGLRVGKICSDGRGGLWVGTEDAGLYHFDPESERFTLFGPSRDFSNIQSLLLDGDDLWVSTFSNGIRVIDTRTWRMRKYEVVQEPGQRLFSNNVFSLEMTHDGIIYIGTMHGLQFYNRDTDDFGFVPQINGGMMVNDILSDSKGNLWVGTLSNGLFQRNPDDGKWTQFLHARSDSTSIPVNNVLSISEDSSGQIWLTTEGGGFCRFDQEKRVFHTYTTADGLPGDIVYRIIEDDAAGEFWISTSKGLVSFNPHKGKVLRVYTSGDGLLCDQFNYGSGFKDSEGNIFFGSVEGLVSFNPGKLAGETGMEDPPVYFTDFSFPDGKVAVGGAGSPLEKDISYTDRIELDYDQNSFSVEMAVLDYKVNPQLLYMLDGVDSRWRTYRGSQVTYSNLAPGHYKLMARSGYGDSSVRTMDIRVRPPWYRSWAAYCFYVLIFIVAAITGMRIYHRRSVLKRKKYIIAYARQKEKEVYDSKISFFTSITHEIRTPLTLIKGPLDNILTGKDKLEPRIAKDLHIMSRNTDRLLVLVNQLLDFQKIEKQNMSLDLSIQNVAVILEDVYSRFGTSVLQQKDCTIEIRDRSLYAMIDAEAFTKIVSNMLSNAMKYSDRVIRIVLSREGDNIRLSVCNDGEMISPDKREAIFAPFFRGTTASEKTGTGIGLYLARSLAELQHGTLTLGAGTELNEFILELPSCDPPSEDNAAAEESAEGQDARDTAADAEFTPDITGETILVVEDDPEMREFIKDQLAEKWSVLTAADGKDALDVLARSNVTLIVSDIMMPVMDGMELCRTVKTDSRYSHIPFILLTAKTSLESKITGMNTGADMYVEKPYSKTYLQAVITNQIKSRQTLRETFLKNPLATMDTGNMSSADTEFIETLQEVIHENLSNSELKLDDIARQMHTSRANLYRKINGVLNISPMDYLRVERLKHAARILAENKYQISEVCYMVGFNSPTYFTKCFYKQFGVVPKDFVRSLHEGKTQNGDIKNQDIR